MLDPWELPDEELWAQLDASLLEDEFRASEKHEAFMRRVALISPGACAALAGAIIRATYSADEFRRTLERCNQIMRDLVNACVARLAAEVYPEKSDQPRRASSQPRTLHLALQANARPVHQHRAGRREWRKQSRG